MPRGYRRFIAAGCIGLAIFAIGAWSQRAAIWADGPSAYPEYRETAEDAQKRLPFATPQQASKSVEDQQPCRNPQGHDASDLCAQWRAADAAQRAARWAWWQLIFSLAGIGGLIVTLWFNFEAWDQARKSEGDTERALTAAEDNARAALKLAESADTNAKKELRAYLDFNGVTLKRWPQYVVPPDQIGMRHRTKIKNYGRTPAENVHITAIFSLEGEAAKEPGPLFKADPVEKPIAIVSPGSSVHEQTFFGLTESLIAALNQGLLKIKVSVLLTYTDVFGERHLLRSEYEYLPNSETMGFTPGTRVST